MKSNFFFEFLKMTPRSYLTHQILLFKILTSRVWPKQNDENQFFNNQNNPTREKQTYSSDLAETMNCTLTIHSKTRAHGSLAQPVSSLSNHPTYLPTCWKVVGTGEAVPAENQFRSVNHSRVFFFFLNKLYIHTFCANAQEARHSGHLTLSFMGEQAAPSPLTAPYRVTHFFCLNLKIIFMQYVSVWVYVHVCVSHQIQTRGGIS